MAVITIIPIEKVLITAKKLVKSTRKDLLLTMILADEINSINKDYLYLLKEKQLNGISIKRICFGKQKDYTRALKRHNFFEQENYFIKYCSKMELSQRLLISDNNQMIFAVYINNKDKIVCYTKNKLIIKGFSQYFNNLFDII